MGNPVIRINQLKSVNWQNGADCIYSLNNLCHIWSVKISAQITAINELLHLLNPDELNRANRYYRETDRQRFIISRGYLRVLLGRYLGQPPQNIEILTGNNQKPFIKNVPLYYNISHSGNYILIGIAGSAIGIDVEKPDEAMHMDDVMEISFSAAETDFVKQSNHPFKSFYLLWTRKEAILKATGKGINEHLKLIPGLDGVHTVEPGQIGSANDWTVSSFNVDDEHIGSMASQSCLYAFWKMF